MQLVLELNWRGVDADASIESVVDSRVVLYGDEVMESIKGSSIFLC